LRGGGRGKERERREGYISYTELVKPPHFSTCELGWWSGEITSGRLYYNPVIHKPM